LNSPNVSGNNVSKFVSSKEIRISTLRLEIIEVLFDIFNIVDDVFPSLDDFARVNKGRGNFRIPDFSFLNRLTTIGGINKKG
jgi:hypothetical protein